jgi:glyoxylase-like metal-dependent hydrolase (beta-lactamase superfamily II)
MQLVLSIFRTRGWPLAAANSLGSIISAVSLLCGFASTALPAPAHPPRDWFHVIRIDANTFALSEPKYWQQNVSYLLIGRDKALLFDSGPGVYSIRDVVKTLTKLPVLVIPSHLHFDHVGRIDEFSEIGLLDTPALRAEVRNGVFVETENQFMLNSATSSFRVTDWIKDGTDIDLGIRKVMLISTPGHTPDSVSIIDVAGKRVFTGDLVDKDVWALTEGANVAQIAASVRRVLQFLPKDGLDHEAHRETPWHYKDLEEEAAAVESVARGQVPMKLGCLGGQRMRTYPAGRFTVTIPEEGVVTLKPLDSKETLLDEPPCGDR